MAIFAQRIERVKIAFPGLASAERLLFARPTRRFRWTDGPFENDAAVPGFCTVNPADDQFDLFDALGKNGHDSDLRAHLGHFTRRISM
jgi:hypothetical protein